MKSFITFGLLLWAATPVIAQTPSTSAPVNMGPVLPDPGPRARGPDLALAVEMAQTAIEVCRNNGYKVTALVTDSVGVPVAFLSDNGAMERTHVVASTKIAMVIKYREPSGATTARSKTDAALAAELAANPKIGTPRQGALPILVGSEIIGAIAVSGAPGGDKDDVCGQAALDRVQSRLQ